MNKKAVLFGLAAAGIAAVAYNRLVSVAEDDFNPEDYTRDSRTDAEPIEKLLKKAMPLSDGDFSEMVSVLRQIGITDALELVDTSNGRQEKFFLQTKQGFFDIYVRHTNKNAFIRKIEDSNGKVILRDIRIAV